MDAVTAVSGSGPAYFALLAEAMIEAGILLGLSREISTQLVVQTMLGTAKQLRDLKMHPVELREMVTSPGGTTIAAIRELEQAGVRAAFLNAIQAAMERSKELARGDAGVTDVEIRVLDDPAAAAGELLAEAAVGGRESGALGRIDGREGVRDRRSAPGVAGATCTSGSATSGRCRPTTSARTTGSSASRCSTGSSRPPIVHRIQGEHRRKRRPLATTASSTGVVLDLALNGIGVGRAYGFALPRAPSRSRRRSGARSPQRPASSRSCRA